MDIEITSNPMTVTVSDLNPHRLILSDSMSELMKGEKILKITMISGEAKFDTLNGIDANSSSISADDFITVTSLAKKNILYFQGVSTGSFRHEIL